MREQATAEPGGPLARARAAARDLVGDHMARSTAVHLGFVAVNSALGLITTIFAGNALGPAGFGILSLGFLVLEFGSIVDNLGTGGFMRDYAGAADDRKLATAFRLKGLLNILTAGAIALLAEPLAAILEVPVALLLILAIIPLTSVFSSVATMVHEARRNPWQRNMPGAVEAVVKTVVYGAFWLVVAAGGDVLLFAWGAVAASLVGEIVGAFLVPWRFSPMDMGRMRYYVGFGLVQQLNGVLDKIVFWVDILVIDLVLGHYDQGLYRVAYSVMALVPLFAGTVGIFLYPALSEAVHQGRRADVRPLLVRGAGYGLAIALPIILLVVLFADPIVRLFGPGFEDAAWMLRALAIVAILPTLLLPFGALFPALDRPGLLLGVSIVTVVTNVVLDVVLIPRYGAAGAIAATAVSFTAGLAAALVITSRIDLGDTGGAPA